MLKCKNIGILILCLCDMLQCDKICLQTCTWFSQACMYYQIWQTFISLYIIKISPLPQFLWPPNLAEWKLILSSFYPKCYSTFWSHGLARSLDKLKPLYFHCQSAYGHLTWLRSSYPFNATITFGHVVLPDHVRNLQCISTTTTSMTTKLGRHVTYHEGSHP